MCKSKVKNCVHDSSANIDTDEVKCLDSGWSGWKWLKPRSEVI